MVLSAKSEAIISKSNPKRIFVAGPAIEINPFCFLETFSPKKYVAPGAAKRNWPMVAIANPSAINNPGYHARNSEWNPKYFAASLCASSWKTNPVPTASNAIGREKNKLLMLKKTGFITTANARLSVSQDIIRSFFSCAEKCKIDFLCTMNYLASITILNVKCPNCLCVLERKELFF